MAASTSRRGSVSAQWIAQPKSMWPAEVKRAELAYVAEKVQGGASQTDAMQATFAEFV